MRNQERRRAKKKGRDARQRSRAAAGGRAGFGDQAGFGDEPGFGDEAGFTDWDAYGNSFGPSSLRQLTTEEVLSSLLTVIFQADDSTAAKEIERGADRLMELSSGPSGASAVSRALLGVAARIVATCWAGGWQPADLARVVGRELTALHVRLVVDMVAAQSRRYAATTLEPRWSAQLSELRATLWWEHDGTYLDHFALREGLDRQATAARVFELLRLLGRLPQIASVGPPPGSYRASPRRAGDARPEPDSRMLNRIRGLLAKAESTEFPEEAEALSAKAQRLMAHHSISAALLDADAGGTNGPAARRIGVDNPYEAPKALLLDAVAAANRCRSVWVRYLGYSTVVGYEADLDAVELLYTSLLVQATTAVTRAGSRQDKYGRSRTRAFRQSFLIAYASRIGDRLTMATDAATSDAAAGILPDDAAGATQSSTGRSDPRLLPVLAARSDAVDDETDRLFPGADAQRLRGSDWEGWAHGTAAADRAILHGHAEIT